MKNVLFPAQISGNNMASAEKDLSLLPPVFRKSFFRQVLYNTQQGRTKSMSDSHPNGSKPIQSEESLFNTRSPFPRAVQSNLLFIGAAELFLYLGGLRLFCQRHPVCFSSRTEHASVRLSSHVLPQCLSARGTVLSADPA